MSSTPWWRPPGAVAVAAGATLLVLALAWPILGAPGERLFGNESVGRFHDPYTVANQFAGSPPPAHVLQPATDLPGLLLGRLLGGVAALNLLLLASFPLAAWTTYLLAHRLTGSRISAAFAAFVFAFSPFHLAHAAYHPHVAQVQWLPLYLLALALALERPSARRLAGLAAALALVALSSFYLGLIAIVATPFALAALRAGGRADEKLPGARPVVRVAAALAAVGVAGALYVAVVAPTLLADPASAATPARDLALYTARPQSYLVPPIEHPILGPIGSAYWDRLGFGPARLEQQLFVGASVLLLAVAGWALGGRRGERRDRRARRLGVVLLVVGFVVSLPPAWRLAGLELPGPSAWIHAVTPMFRALARFGVLVGLGLALLAGIGLDGIWRLRGRGRTPTLAALGLLALFELTPIPPLRGHDVLPTSAHRWLAGLRDPGVTLDCAPAADPAVLSARDFFPHELVFLEPGEDCLEPELAERRSGDGVARVLLRGDDPAALWLDRNGLPEHWSLQERFQDSVLYRLDVRPAPAYVRRGPGFYALELAPGRAHRWMAGRAELRLTNRHADPLPVRLALTLRAFPSERRLEVRKEGSVWTTLRVGSEATRLDLPPLTLRAGTTTLELRALEPPTVPDALLGNGDRRPITLALESWNLEPAAATLEATSGEPPLTLATVEGSSATRR